MAGIVTLVTLIAVSIVSGEEYQISSAEKYIERLKISFEKEVADKFTELGFPETIEQDDYSFGSQFSESARRDFDEMIRNYERQLSREEKFDKKELKKEYQAILEQLKLPSEMAAQLIKNPLTNDKEKSEMFIIEYIQKLEEILDGFYQVYFKHHELIDKTIVDGSINIEKFMEKLDTYPEELRDLLIGLEKQNYYPSLNSKYGTFLADIPDQ